MHSVRGKKTLPSATLSFLSLPSATPNQHALSNYINHKTPNIQNPKKFKYWTHPKYMVIIERFQKRSDVMQKPV